MTCTATSLAAFPVCEPEALSTNNLFSYFSSRAWILNPVSSHAAPPSLEWPCLSVLQVACLPFCEDSQLFWIYLVSLSTSELHSASPVCIADWIMPYGDLLYVYMLSSPSKRCPSRVLRKHWLNEWVNKWMDSFAPDTTAYSSLSPRAQEGTNA